MTRKATKKPQGRPKGRVAPETMPVRIPVDIVAQVDKWAQKQIDRPMRAHAVRMLLRRALAAV